MERSQAVARCAALTAGIWLSGCAAAPKVYEYPALRLKIVAGDPDFVDSSCRSAGRMEFDDEGAHLARDRRVNGCWCERTRTMYVNWDKPETVVHELCHVAGRPRKDCAGVRWEWY